MIAMALMSDPEAVGTGEVTARAAELLEEPSYAQRARELGEEIRSQASPAEVVTEPEMIGVFGSGVSSNSTFVTLAISARTLSAVPTGTVDLSTTILKFSMLRPISLATLRTFFRSAEPSSSGGVPTAMKFTRSA